MSVFKIILLTSCLVLSACHPHTKYTEQEAYVEKYEWNQEKGIVKTYQASWSAQWE